MFTDRELINLLLTRAGMMMEDAHSAALIDEGPLGTRIAAVRQAGAAVVALSNAADLLSMLQLADDDHQ